MKRILLFAAVSVALTGCVNDETESFDATPSNKKITFEAPFLGKVATRTAQTGEISTNEAYPENESFMVWGWYHENDYENFQSCTNYMGTGTAPVRVSKESNKNYWISNPVYYWPNKGKLTFAAYSPADAQGNFSYTASGLQIKDFVVPAVDQQYDLLYSNRTYNCQQSSIKENVTPGNYSGIQIDFKHALSSIRFMAKTKDTYSTMTFKITKIEVQNVLNSGSFDQNITKDESGETDCSPEWTPKKNEESVSYVAFNNNDNESNSYTVTTTLAEPSTLQDLLLMPQTFENKDEAKIKVYYTMKSKDGNAISCEKEFQLNSSTNASEWESGKRYTYQIIFALNEIYFAPVVTDWEPVTVSSDLDL